MNEGANKIPTINVKDLIKFVVKVSEGPPELERYLLYYYLLQCGGQLQGKDIKGDCAGDF